MVPIIGGAFQMGCLATDLACNTDEQPLHSVDVSDFSIDETEVTQAAYDLCIRAGTCVAPPCSSWQPTTKGNWPVACVNWTEAMNYCNWLGKRLPTEAEWEIAAHGNAGFIYPWGNQTPDCTRANFTLCSFNSSQSVRNFIAGKSVYNAYDMAGNVGEWVSDWYGSYDLPPMPNPSGPPSGSQRVVRGGDYLSQSSVIRASHRVAIDPITRVDDIGFRCAKPGF
jgi:formylglycine-generating enzyme required for sulfatase activity